MRFNHSRADEQLRLFSNSLPARFHELASRSATIGMTVEGAYFVTIPGSEEFFSKIPHTDLERLNRLGKDFYVSVSPDPECPDFLKLASCNSSPAFAGRNIGEYLKAIGVIDENHLPIVCECSFVEVRELPPSLQGEKNIQVADFEQITLSDKRHLAFSLPHYRQDLSEHEIMLRKKAGEMGILSIKHENELLFCYPSQNKKQDKIASAKLRELGEHIWFKVNDGSFEFR